MARRSRQVPQVAPEYASFSRSDKTKHITEAAVQYWIAKGYSCHIELGLVKRGSLRADVFCLNTKSDIVITEVKSCWQDFKTDSKWQNYLPYCMRMYFAVDELLYASHGEKIIAQIKELGCGLMVINNMGTCRVVSNARRTQMENKILAKMLIKCAWRGGRFK